MQRQEVLSILVDHQNALKSFGVQSLLLFDSVAGNEVRIDGDVDLLVAFEQPIGLFMLLRLKPIY